MQIVAETAQKYSVQSAGQSRSPGSCAGYVSWTGGRHTPVDMVVLCTVVYLQSTCMYSHPIPPGTIKRTMSRQSRFTDSFYFILYPCFNVHLFSVQCTLTTPTLPHKFFCLSLPSSASQIKILFFSPLPLFLFSLSLSLSFLSLGFPFLLHPPTHFFFLLVRLQSLQVSLSFFVFFSFCLESFRCWMRL